MADPNRPERPGPDATLSEIYEWMEEDFWHEVAAGLNDGSDEDEDGPEVVEVEIIDYDRGEVVGTIDTDGNLTTSNNALRELSQKYTDEGIPVLVPTTYENENGEIEHADTEVRIEPGTTGFVRAFVDKLPSPYDCDLDVLDDLPVYDVEHTSE